MNLTETPRYGLRATGNPHGTVHTRPEVVEAMLDLVGYRSESDLSNIRLLDPAGGDGVFVLEALRRLSDSARRHGFSFAAAYESVRVVELDPTQAAALRNRLHQCLNKLGRLGEVPNPDTIVRETDFLLFSSEPFDVVVGNPPYVRFDNIPNGPRAEYQRRYRTFTHRADLYVPFFEKSLRLLSAGGRLCFICANRWLKNAYGKGLRTLITRGYTLSVVVDLEGARPFAEEVIAYPALTLIENRWSEDPIRWYETTDLGQLTRLDQLPVKHLPHPRTGDWQHTFREDGDRATHQLKSIEEQGFQLGIGVATGADAVFIRQEWPIEAELLVPILMASDLKGNQLKWSGHYLFNPYGPDGQLVELARYPRLEAYLIQHEATLKRRYVATKNPANWYRTIDKVQPNLLARPKLLLPDISANRCLFVDEGDFYPHHNLYYVVGPDLPSLKILGAFLMTASVREQLARLTTRMNGGYLRWQSQHLRKLLLPVISQLTNEQRATFIEAFDTGNLGLAETAYQAVSIPHHTEP